MSNEATSLLLPAFGATLVAGYLYLRSSSVGPGLVRLCVRPSEVIYIDAASVVLIRSADRFLSAPDGKDYAMSRVLLEGQDPIDVIHDMSELREFFPAFAQFSQRDGSILVNPLMVKSVRRSGYVNSETNQPSTKIALKNTKDIVVFEDPDTVICRLGS